MPHGPAYDFSPDEKPDVWWEKPDGSWLGFWTREWPDLLGEAVLGKMTYLVQGVHEDLLLGAGLGYDLSRRPR